MKTEMQELNDKSDKLRKLGRENMPKGWRKYVASKMDLSNTQISNIMKNDYTDVNQKKKCLDNLKKYAEKHSKDVLKKNTEVINIINS